tara:strand:- start:85 stop:1503 length:1419 start_codon:yes stop_codon:yes gene_type:complete
MNLIKKKINSWTLLQKLNCNIVYPKNTKELKEVLNYAKKNNLSVIAMGHGCSYGDLFMHSKGIIINFKNLNKIINFNSQNNTLLVEPGISVSEVNQFLFNKNLTINSIPSNFEITVGGAISNNVYGKDSHNTGYFSSNVSKITYINDNLDTKTLSKKDNRVEFEKFIGSIGLLGIITEIEIIGSELKSQYLNFKNYYLNNFDEFFQFQQKMNLKEIAFCSFKIDPFSKNEKFGRACVTTYNWDFTSTKDNLKKIRDVNLYKKITLFGFTFYLPRKKYNLIKKLVFSIAALVSNRYVWKILHVVSFLYFKINDRKIGKLHILDLYSNNNFTNHNILFKPRGFYFFQISIPIKIYYSVVIKLLKIVQKDKNEPFMCQIMMLPKRKDFIYEMDDHISITIPLLKSKNNKKQDLLLKEIVGLVIDNKCQLNLAKDNVINKEDGLKIFPKIKEFEMLKKDLDKNCFFSSSYYERILK